MMKKHHKTLFTNEQELLKAILKIHNHNDLQIDLDPMFFKGKFYQDGLPKPKKCFDLNPQLDFVIKGNATNINLKNNSLNSIILDPPFLFGKHGKTKNYYSAKTHTMFQDWKELEKMYKGIITEAQRLLKQNGLLIFKCQDYTDSKTTITHYYVQKWLEEFGFYIKDLAILNKPNKIYNSNTTQRHLRKTHTYFFIAIKKSDKIIYKNAYNKFINWYKDKLKNDFITSLTSEKIDKFGFAHIDGKTFGYQSLEEAADFVSQTSEGILGYSDNEWDNGEYLEEARDLEIISEYEFELLWKDFMGDL